MTHLKFMIASLKVRVAEMRQAESGSFSVEGVLMFPLLLWAYMGMFSFFEGLRENNINLKAAYTIGDLLSRETEEIDRTDLEGMRDVFGWLTRSQNLVTLRVTVVRYDEDTDRHVLVWSRATEGEDELDQEGIDVVVTPHVPIMADADTAIVVETWADFEPLMEIGLQDTEIYNIIVTAPRFSEQLLWEGLNDGTGSVHVDGTGAEDTDV